MAEHKVSNARVHLPILPLSPREQISVFWTSVAILQVPPQPGGWQTLGDPYLALASESIGNRAVASYFKRLGRVWV